MKTMFLAAVACGCLGAGAAHADLLLQFDEGAPKDRFTLTNTSSCAIANTAIEIDLQGSSGGLIFDVTGSGAGVEVFQPFELVAGADSLHAAPVVKDGDRAILLDVKRLGAGGAIAFTIDVDDTGGGREITVSGSEIAGAAVRLGDKAGVFDESARARLSLGCMS